MTYHLDMIECCHGYWHPRRRICDVIVNSFYYSHRIKRDIFCTNPNYTRHVPISPRGHHILEKSFIHINNLWYCCIDFVRCMVYDFNWHYYLFHDGSIFGSNIFLPQACCHLREIAPVTNPPFAQLIVHYCPLDFGSPNCILLLVFFFWCGSGIGIGLPSHDYGSS